MYCNVSSLSVTLELGWSALSNIEFPNLPVESANPIQNAWQTQSCLTILGLLALD